MLVEKKSWKNLIKPVMKYTGIYLSIFLLILILFKLGPGNTNIVAKTIIAIVIGSSLVWLFFVLTLCNLEQDFYQVVKVDDLSTLNNDELLDYNFELWNYTKADKQDAEFQRVQNEIDKRHLGTEYINEKDSITIEIKDDRKIYFSEIMQFINESNVIPVRIKESLKEDILKTYTKAEPLGERFTTSKENAAVFNAAYNEVTTINQGYGDYGFIYEYENWKWQYGKGKKN